MPLWETIGIWLGAFLTLCIFSFLYKDNPFYKLAEHLFVGISAGYWATLEYHNVFRPNLWDPLTQEGRLSLLVSSDRGRDHRAYLLLLLQGT
jgi:hypothetical protein